MSLKVLVAVSLGDLESGVYYQKGWTTGGVPETEAVGGRSRGRGVAAIEAMGDG